MPETLTIIDLAPHLACAYCLCICLCLPVLGCPIRYQGVVSACTVSGILFCIVSGIRYQVSGVVSGIRYQMLANADRIAYKAF